METGKIKIKLLGCHKMDKRTRAKQQLCVVNNNNKITRGKVKQRPGLLVGLIILIVIVTLSFSEDRDIIKPSTSDRRRG